MDKNTVGLYGITMPGGISFYFRNRLISCASVFYYSYTYSEFRSGSRVFCWEREPVSEMLMKPS